MIAFPGQMLSLQNIDDGEYHPQLRGPVPDDLQAEVRLVLRARQMHQEVLRLVRTRLLRSGMLHLYCTLLSK